MKRTPLKRKKPLRAKMPLLVKALADQANLLQSLRKPDILPVATIRKAAKMMQPRPRKLLPPVSKKRAVQNREYEKAKRQWRAGHDGQCEMEFCWDGNPSTPGTVRAIKGSAGRGEAMRCHRRAMAQPHHAKGRGPFLSDISTFIGLCHECHRWVDTHRKQAVALGYFTYVNP